MEENEKMKKVSQCDGNSDSENNVTSGFCVDDAEKQQNEKKALVKKICLIVGMLIVGIFCLVAFINPSDFLFGNFAINSRIRLWISVVFMLAFLALGILKIVFIVKPNKTLLLSLISFFPVFVFMTYLVVAWIVHQPHGASFYDSMGLLILLMFLFYFPFSLILGIISIVIGAKVLSQKNKHDMAGIILSCISILIIIGFFLQWIISWLIS